MIHISAVAHSTAPLYGHAQSTTADREDKAKATSAETATTEVTVRMTEENEKTPPKCSFRAEVSLSRQTGAPVA